MGNFGDVFCCAWNNDAKGLNKLIGDAGRQHRADYMAEMMLEKDVYEDYQLLVETENKMRALYCAVNENYALKAKGREILKCQSPGSLVLCNKPRFLTESQLYDLVYCQALKYYFGEDISDVSDSDARLNRAILHRRTSVCLQHGVGYILSKIAEDIDIITADTQNLNFLIESYGKIVGNGYRLQDILKLLADSVRNVVLRDNKFEEEYFETAKQLMRSMCQYFGKE